MAQLEGGLSMTDGANCKQIVMLTRTNRAQELIESIVLAAAVSGLLYFGYFQLAPWIWSQNQPFRPDEIAIWQLLWLEDRDGIELYALYILMFLDLIVVYAVSYEWIRIAERRAQYLLVFPILVAGAYFYSIGFHPPMNNLSIHAVPEILAWLLRISMVALPITALLYYLQLRSYYLALVFASLLLIPICFISTDPIEWYDYSFILAPALSLLQGESISGTYMPYDLLLSLLGVAWMKLHLDLNSFQIVGQLSYYMLMLGIFAFSRSWFLDKRLSAFLLVALVLVRIYAGPFDAVHAPQLTPVRIDLWLILLVLVYFKGPHHWSAGLFCGLMLLLHHNFGLIYTAAYIQLLLTLCVLDMMKLSGSLINNASNTIGALLKNNLHNLVLILLGVLAHYLLFRNVNESSHFSFESLRISFTKVSAISFYWYVMIVSGLSFTILLRVRTKISSNYLSAGLCLIYLAIGNSLYFFGHSHENAIIVLSAVLLLMIFMLLDITGPFLDSESKNHSTPFLRKNMSVIVSLILIASITFWYGDNITRKASIQARGAIHGQFIFPSEVPIKDIQNTIASVKSIAGDNQKVYFVGDYDLLFYYYGGYTQVGYYNPVYSWISRGEFNKFLQELVDQGYYLVVDDGLIDVLEAISFSNSKSIEGRWVAWK